MPLTLEEISGPPFLLPVYLSVGLEMALARGLSSSSNFSGIPSMRDDMRGPPFYGASMRRSPFRGSPLLRLDFLSDGMAETVAVIVADSSTLSSS